MAKLKLQPDPTFKLAVPIGVPGAVDQDVEFVFKYRNRDEMQTFLKQFEKAGETRYDGALLMTFIAGWDLLDQFTPENLETLCLNYPAAPDRILSEYIREHAKARAKN